MLFSVIVPIYNVEIYLERCIDSILSQTFTDFEVLLVDDGSRDRSPEICDAYAAKDSRVRVIHKANGGLVSARNAGIKAARGEYIDFIDGDDWAKPELLQFVSDRLAESPVKLDMVLFAADKVYADRTAPFLNLAPEGYYDREKLEKLIFPYLLSDRRDGFHLGTTIQGHLWNKVSRRELQEAYYVRDERIRMFTDVPVTYECLLNCQNIYLCNERLYMYNANNSQSILAVGKNNYLTKSFYYLIAYLQDRLSGYGSEIDRQINDYPALLIKESIWWQLKNSDTFGEAVEKVKKGLKESGLLQFVDVSRLPVKEKIKLSLLNAHLYRAAMLPVAISVKNTEQRENRRSRITEKDSKQ